METVAFNTDIDIDCSVLCDCGRGPCTVVDTETNYHELLLTIQPCKYCLEEAEEKGYKSGYNKGREDEYQDSQDI